MMMAFSLDAASFVRPQDSKAYPEVSFQIFYDQLSPYGQWVDYPGRGYVWVPNDEEGFMPYSSGGYWAYTDYGWTWVSNYPWGWAPFHYGRWDFDDDYGWYWAPDYQWSPAWVAWADCPGYYGWTPLRPGVDVDVVITGGYRVRPERWCFAHDEYMGQRDIDRHFAPREENLPLIGRSRMIPRTNVDPVTHSRFAAGPDPQQVSQVTHRPVNQLALTPASRPGQAIRGSQLAIYRPAVTKTTMAAPTKVANLNQLKPLPGRAPTINRGLNNQSNRGANIPSTAPSLNRGREANPAASPTLMRNQQMPNASPAFNMRKMPQGNQSPPAQQSNRQLLRQLPRQVLQQQAPQAMPQRQNAPQIRSTPQQQQRIAPQMRNMPAQQMRSMPQQQQQRIAPQMRNTPAPQMRSMPQQQQRIAPQMRNMPAPEMRSVPAPQMHSAPPPQMRAAPQPPRPMPAPRSAPPQARGNNRHP